VPTSLFPSGTNESERSTLNSRIDSAIKEFAGVRRRSGTHGTYEVFVDIENVPCMMRGVEKCSKAISRVVDAIER
jgi:hypothetical protein